LHLLFFLKKLDQEDDDEEAHDATMPSFCHSTEVNDDDNALTMTAADDKYPALEVLEGLGRGGYSTVVKVLNSRDGKVHAMKVVPKNVSENQLKRDNHLDQLSNELKVMTEISPSPFVQRCKYAFESANSVFFIIDLNTGGDLFYHLVKRIESGCGFSENECRVLLAEVYLALEHLHKHNVLHRDIKIENIMLDASGHVKLVDFGLSSVIETQVSHMRAVGSLIYMAPELIKFKTGGRHTDWWAYGVLAHELLTGKTPWSSLTNTKIITREVVHKELSMPSTVSQEAFYFISRLLCKDPARRMGSHHDEEIKLDPFFSGVNWEAMARLECEPAFVPSAINVNKEDQDEALEHYHMIMKGASSLVNDNQWMLGLDSYSKYLV
jgi:serine/threonine protein kinase